MFPQTPDQRLAYIKQKQSALIAEAASDRLVARKKARDRGFTGLRLQIGALFIVIGRTICEDEVLRRNAAHS